MAQKKMPRFLHVVNDPWRNCRNSKGEVVGTFYPCAQEPFSSHKMDGSGVASSEIYVHESHFHERIREEVSKAWREAACFYMKEGGGVNMDLLAVANKKRMGE